MITTSLHGFILLSINLMFSKNFMSSKLLWNECLVAKLLLCKLRISHHVSCPHAHQQNGSAERKHRHIVEVGLALLAQASMPLKFWDEAFLTASYLINRTPSKVIKFETPIEKLLNQKPNYQFLRVFGCACWPNLRPYNNHKLQFRSKQCVFLGYSHLYKGFKCLDASTDRVYISRDVVFDGNVFPFSTLHSNAGARLRSEISLLPSFLVPHSTDQGGEHGVDHMLNAPAELPDEFFEANAEESAEESNAGSAGTGGDVHGANTDEESSPGSSSAQPEQSASGTEAVLSPAHSASRLDQTADAQVTYTSADRVQFPDDEAAGHGSGHGSDAGNDTAQADVMGQYRLDIMLLPDRKLDYKVV